MDGLARSREASGLAGPSGTVKRSTARRARVADGSVQGELSMTDVLLRGLGWLLLIALVALALSVRAA
jgi:hypothetical protein